MRGHDDIVALCVKAIPAQFDTRTEFQVDRNNRADLVVFERSSRRPVMVVEVKESITTGPELRDAVGQVARYQSALVCETPAAKVLPVVVGGRLTVELGDLRVYAFAWSLGSFPWAIEGNGLYRERDVFFDRPWPRRSTEPADLAS